MTKFSVLAVAAVLSILGRTSAFSTPRSNSNALKSSVIKQEGARYGSTLNLVPPAAVESAAMAAESVVSNTNLVLSEVRDYGELTKSVFIVLLFGGGLIPAAIAANQSMIGTLRRKRPEKKELTDEEKKTYLDPTFGAADYLEDSGATGPNLAASPLLFAPERIPLADIVAIVGRMTDVESVANWRDLPSTKIDGIVNKDKPPMWLPRATFKANIRKNKFQGWPVDGKGLPVGGEELKAAESKRVSAQNALISDAALDAVFDSWAWGANIATPDKVGNQLRSWRPNSDTLNLASFQAAAVSGRAVTGIGALSFVVIQVVAYGALFIAPALRAFLNIDIGFGQMGTCDPETCTRLFGDTFM